MKFPFKLPLILDGATGTNLIAKGLPSGVCPEQWILENRDIILSLQKEFLNAGADVLLTPTFGVNRQKLKSFGLEKYVEKMNKELADLTRSTAGKSALVAGDLSTSGFMIKPYGDANFDDVYHTYFEQAQALKNAGVDFLIFETQMFLSDMRAGVLAAKKLNIPVFVTMTIEENGKTIMGEDPLAILITLQSMGADAVGINCSCGPQKLAQALKKILPHAQVPLIAKPNAGKPCENNSNVYNLSPEEFADEMSSLYDEGIYILGGCCGTTPKHIETLSNKIKDKTISIEQSDKKYSEACVVGGKTFFLSNNMEFSSHIKCDYDMIDDILEIEDNGKNILSVLVSNIEDADMLLECSHMIKRPLAVYSNDENVLEYTLKSFQGRLIINADTEIDKFTLKQLSKKYGSIIY